MPPRKNAEFDEHSGGDDLGGEAFVPEEPVYEDPGMPMEPGLEEQTFHDQELLPSFADEEEPSVVALRTDSYEDSNIAMDPRRRIPSVPLPFAPEMNPGLWRERSIAPRGLLSKNQIVAGLQRGLQTVELQKKLAVPILRQDLLGLWMPFLRQAVEQLAGDGLDVHLTKILKPPARKGRDKFLEELTTEIKKLHTVSQREILLAQAKKILKIVAAAFSAPTKRTVSLKLLETELESRLDISVVLQILFASKEGLNSRLQQTEASAESIRSSLRSMPGHHPDGMMWNYSRLKMEKRLIAAELASRK